MNTVIVSQILRDIASSVAQLADAIEADIDDVCCMECTNCGPCKITEFGCCVTCGIDATEIVKTKFTCVRCKDTHRMLANDGSGNMWLCTECPMPCKICRSGIYCANTPCICGCHDVAVKGDVASLDIKNDITPSQCVYHRRVLERVVGC